MVKIARVLIAVAAAVVGAEVVKKKYPDLPKKIASQTLKTLKTVGRTTTSFIFAAKDAFKDGYVSGRKNKASAIS